MSKLSTTEEAEKLLERAKSDGILTDDFEALLVELMDPCPHEGFGGELDPEEENAT